MTRSHTIRRTLTRALVVFCLLWPAVQMTLVVVFHIEAWRFYAWGMYSTAIQQAQVSVDVYDTDGNLTFSGYAAGENQSDIGEAIALWGELAPVDDYCRHVLDERDAARVVVSSSLSTLRGCAVVPVSLPAVECTRDD